MEQLLIYVRERLKEPSTWRGLILLATALGAKLNPDLQVAIITVGLALVGAAGAITPDKKN